MRRLTMVLVIAFLASSVLPVAKLAAQQITCINNAADIEAQPARYGVESLFQFSVQDTGDPQLMVSAVTRGQVREISLPLSRLDETASCGQTYSLSAEVAAFVGRLLRRAQEQMVLSESGCASLVVLFENVPSGDINKGIPYMWNLQSAPEGLQAKLLIGAPYLQGNSQYLTYPVTKLATVPGAHCVIGYEAGDMFYTGEQDDPIDLSRFPEGLFAMLEAEEAYFFSLDGTTLAIGSFRREGKLIWAVAEGGTREELDRNTESYKTFCLNKEGFTLRIEKCAD